MCFGKTYPIDGNKNCDESQYKTETKIQRKVHLFVTIQDKAPIYTTVTTDKQAKAKEKSVRLSTS